MKNSITKFSARHALLLFAVLLPAGILLYAFLTQSAGTARPKVKDGRVDLSSWDFDKNGNISLNGEWRFVWNQLIGPTDSVPASAGTIKVPGIWNGYEMNGKKLPAAGYATYILDLKLAGADAEYALNMMTVSNAYKMWINEKLISANGTVGTSKENSVPAYSPKILRFNPGKENVRITVQVSNFAHCKGGFWLPLQIGKTEDMQQQRDGRVLLEMFLFGCLFIMAMYHFSLFLLRRSDLSTLYFGLMCIAIGVRSLLTGENLINTIVPDLSWFAARKTEYMLTFISAPVYVSFSRILYPNQWNKTIYRIIVGFGIALALFVLFTPSTVYTNTSYVFTAYAWLTSMYTIYVFSRAAIKRQEGAGIFLATSLFFLLTIVNDTLNQLEIVHTGLYLSFGLLIVTFAQSFVLSSRFSNSFRMTELYAATFRKFVPGQFLDKIAKDGIASIKAGNAEQGSVTVLFADIRSFTSLAEEMRPDEVFTMLNEYLSYVEPPIRAHNGYVDKYMGDGIMALFEDGNEKNGASNAVHASLDMFAALESYNEMRKRDGKKELKMGIGLHSGNVIIGTVGGNERMDSTAIGDAVNLASRVEGMTKMYGVGLLISGQTLNLLEDRNDFYFRFADTVTAKGKNEAVEIWEIAGRHSVPAAEKFKSMLAVYEEAIANMKAGDFSLAISKFENCLALVPADRLSEIQLEKCWAILSGKIAGPVTRLDEK